MRKILIVDDDKDIAEVVQLILMSNGYLVDTYSTGFDVPHVVDHYKPDLILLDINLPGKLGTDICNELKEISDLPPIILFSAHAKRDISLLKCRADGFIGKPFEVANLIDTIRAHVA